MVEKMASKTSRSIARAQLLIMRPSFLICSVSTVSSFRQRISGSTCRTKLIRGGVASSRRSRQVLEIFLRENCFPALVSTCRHCVCCLSRVFCRYVQHPHIHTKRSTSTRPSTTSTRAVFPKHLSTATW